MEVTLETMEEISTQRQVRVLRAAARQIRRNADLAGELFDLLPPAVWAAAFCNLLTNSMDGDCRAQVVALLGAPETDEMLKELVLRCPRGSRRTLLARMR